MKTNFRLLIILFFCIFLIESNLSYSGKKHKLTILYTNDEHGWVESDSINAGAANIYELINQTIKKDENVLLLSGGDNFAAAPPFSMETKGNATMEVFKVLGYYASPIGNHEFDFGVSVFKENQRTSNLIYLSANIIREDTGLVPDYTRPYIIKDFSNFKVGILGLANFETPSLTHPNNIKGLVLRTYEETLKQYLPILKDKSDVIIVLIHDCSNRIISDYNLLTLFDEYNVAFVGTGHCHQITNKKENNTIIVETGSYLKNYAKINLEFEEDTKKIISTSEIIKNENKINRKKNIVDFIIDKFNEDLTNERQKNMVVVGKLERDYFRNTDEYYNLIISTWFDQFTDADFGILNRGSIRQDMKKGDITVATIKLIMPFDNSLYLVDIKGEDLKEVIENKKILNYHKVDNKINLISNPDQIIPEKIYKVILPDFLFNGGDKVNLTNKCKNLIDKKMNYHEPVINYFLKYKIIK